MKVSLANAPAVAEHVELLLNGRYLPASQIANEAPGNYSVDLPATTDPKDPAFLPLGPHPMALRVDGHFYAGTSTIDILSPAQTVPVLTGVSPEVFVPADRHSPLVLSGSGFLTDPQEDNTITVSNVLIPVRWDGCDHPEAWTSGAQHVAHGSVEPGGRQITLCNLSMPHEASVELAVHQGSLAPSGVKLIVSPWHTGTILFFSVLVDAIGLGVILLLAATVRKVMIANERYGLLRILYLDPETNTYSLSKYQFYLWTAASLFTYTYLAISRMLVQQLSLPDVPYSLPGIIGIGAGTAVGAQIVTAVRGPKGSGPEKPTLGDFITSGGVAAPERVQMFLWTNLAVLFFCIATIRYAPWQITGLPEIGSGLLFLSGLSSAGYLGGKLARKPGPVLNEIFITPAWSTGAPPVSSNLPNVPALPGLAASATVQTPLPRVALAQPIAEAQSMLRSAQAKFDATDATDAEAAAAARSGAQGALTALRSALEAAQSGAALGVLGELAARADAASQQAAAAFSEATAHGDPAETSALLAELAQECAAAAQSLATGASEATGSALAGHAAQEQVAAQAAQADFVRSITLRGRNLSTDATFEINGVELPFRMLGAVGGVHGPQRIAPEDDLSLTNMGRELRLSILPGSLDKADRASYDAWFSPRQSCLRLMVVNPDGQSAEISFNVPPGTAQSHT